LAILDSPSWQPAWRREIASAKNNFAKNTVEMLGKGKHGNPCGDSHIITATATTIMYLKTGKAPPKTRYQSHSHRKGLVNHVSGPKT
jgi:hypothetical protein